MVQERAAAPDFVPAMRRLVLPTRYSGAEEAESDAGPASEAAGAPDSAVVLHTAILGPHHTPGPTLMQRRQPQQRPGMNSIC